MTVATRSVSNYELFFSIKSFWGCLPGFYPLSPSLFHHFIFTLLSYLAISLFPILSGAFNKSSSQPLRFENCFPLGTRHSLFIGYKLPSKIRGCCADSFVFFVRLTKGLAALSPLAISCLGRPGRRARQGHAHRSRISAAAWPRQRQSARLSSASGAAAAPFPAGRARTKTRRAQQPPL